MKHAVQKAPRTPTFPGGLNGGQYQPLSMEEIQKIHRATLDVLSTVGFSVRCPEALDLFRAGGAQIDENESIVRVSEDFLWQQLQTAPSDVILYGRENRHNLLLGGRRVYLGPGGTALNILDARSGECRRSTLKDLVDIVRLVDNLENVHFLLLPTYPSDLPEADVDVNRFFAGFNRSTKHIMGGVYTSEGIERVIRMAEKIAGSSEALRQKPFFSMITCGISPLLLDEKYGSFMIQVARHGIPLAVPSEPLTGATSPVTLAGNLVIQNCDALINVMCTQLANPGTPVITGCVATSTDLRDLKYLGGSIESGLINAAAAQMAQFYELPYYGTAGISDAKTIDAQCGYESAMNNLLVALAGANFIHDAAGLMEFALTVCPEKYVVDNEIIGMVMRAVEGIRVNDETLAVDVIRKVGPGGHFISQRHTRRHMRREHYAPLLSDRQTREDWIREGSVTTLTRASRIVEDILTRDTEPRLPGDLLKNLREEFPDIAWERQFRELAS